MYKKEVVFGQDAYALAPEKTLADYTKGMQPNTIAMAEDVNQYGKWSDQWVMSIYLELKHLLEAYGETLTDAPFTDPGQWNNEKNKMLLNVIRSKLALTRNLTGVIYDGTNVTPIQNGNSIVFPAFKASFNQTVYYETTEAQNPVVSFERTTVSANSTWETGVHYIYATKNGAISHQRVPVAAADGADKCYLGSVYVTNGAFQTESDGLGTWKYQPWLQITAAENREAPTAYTKGGFMSPYNATSVQMGALQIMDEGINFDANPLAPNIVTIAAKAPMSYKYLYPGYNPTSAGTTTLDTTKIYNTTTGAFDTLTAGVTPKFIVVVPCITPAGQTLMIPAMSPRTDDGVYANVFDSQEAAEAAIFGLQYDLQGVADRVIYIGQSLIVQVGADDLTNPEQFKAVGIVPQALAGFTSAAGQSGGGTGEYIPMKSYTFPSTQTSVTCMNNCANIIEGNLEAEVAITMPTPLPKIINQFEIQYTHTEGKQGLRFPTTVTWWGSAPTWNAGVVYNIIFEYIGGVWRGGFLSQGA
jgi:hypothetical protein